MSYKTDGIYLGDKYYEATKSECGSGSGPSKLLSVMDGSVEVLNEEDFGDIIELRKYAFNSCMKLKEVHLPETIKKVDDSVFANTNNGNGAEVYYNGTFEYVGASFGTLETREDSIVYNKLNDNLYAILNKNGYNDNETAININENCEYIAQCFLHSSVTSINIPQNVKSINLINGKGITNLTIPDNVQYIHFIDCSNLTSITLGSGLKFIKDYCFSVCSNLTSITYNGTVEQFNNIKPGIWGFTQEIDVVCSDGTVKINAPKQFTIKLVNTGTQTVDFTPALSGTFNTWSTTPMTQDGNTYTATVTGAPPVEFFINNNGNWDKQISIDNHPFRTTTDCTITANFDEFPVGENVTLTGTLTEGV